MIDPSRRLSLDRRHSLAGRDTLDWFFKNRKWIRTSPLTLVESGWATRPRPEGEAGIRFLLIATKRSYKRAHDRNKIRRWLRAAITETEEFSYLEEAMLARGEQLLVMMRISKPIRTAQWNGIVNDVRTIAMHLAKRV